MSTKTNHLATLAQLVRSRRAVVLMAIIVGYFSWLSCKVYLQHIHSERVIQVTNKAKSVLYALRDFVSIHGHFPFAASSFSGNDLGQWTWRLQIVMLNGDWPRDINVTLTESWDSDRNKAVATNIHVGQTISWNDKSALFSAVKGVGTLWENAIEVPTDFRLHRVYLLFIETHCERVVWLAPRDIDVNELKGDAPLSHRSDIPPTVVAAFSDGWLCVLRTSIPQQLVASLARGEFESQAACEQHIAPWIISASHAHGL